MTIGELSKKTGVGIQTIRYYEQRGLLPQAHRWAGSDYRDFDADAESCLQFIGSAKTLGFTLNEIQQLLDLRVPPRGSCQEVETHLRKKITELDQRMTDIRKMRRTLTKLIAACTTCRAKTSCLVLWNLEHSPVKAKSNVAKKNTAPFSRHAPRMTKR